MKSIFKDLDNDGVPLR